MTAPLRSRRSQTPRLRRVEIVRVFEFMPLSCAPGGAARTWERGIAAGQLVVEARLPVPGTPRGSGAS